MITLPTFPDMGLQLSTSEVIAKNLREAIISGRLSEDTPIRQDEIAKSFNVSKIPVREALKRLEAEGLVAFHRNRGAVVTRLSEPELAQIFEVRIMLETQAIQLAIPNMTAEDLNQAEAICDEFERIEKADRWAQLNWEFHACLYQAGQRPFLLNLIRSVHDKIERYLRIQISLSPQAKAQAHVEHRELILTCRNQDVAAATRLLEVHISGVCQSLYSHLPTTLGSRLTLPTAKALANVTAAGEPLP